METGISTTMIMEQYNEAHFEETILNEDYWPEIHRALLCVWTTAHMIIARI